MHQGSLKVDSFLAGGQHEQEASAECDLAALMGENLELKARVKDISIVNLKLQQENIDLQLTLARIKSPRVDRKEGATSEITQFQDSPRNVNPEEIVQRLKFDDVELEQLKKKAHPRKINRKSSMPIPEDVRARQHESPETQFMSEIKTTKEKFKNVRRPKKTGTTVYVPSYTRNLKDKVVI